MSISDNSASSVDKTTINSGEVNKIALVVGVNNSAIPNSRDDLQHAEQDASDVAWILGESPCKFERIAALRGKEAETRDVQKAIIRLIEGRNNRDFLLFYFSGHAQPMETSGGHKDIYLVTYDFKESDVIVSPAMHLSLRWLREVLYQQTEACAVLLILDCCYAGNIIHAGVDPYHIDLGKLFEDWLEASSVRVRQDRPRVTLTATGYNITAQEKNGHGLMTRWLLHALRGTDGEVLDDNGQTDIHLLHKYLKKKIPEQCPNLAGEFGQYPWILASHPNRSARFHQQAKEAEENELRNEIFKEVNRIITVADHFEKLAARNMKPYTQPFDHITCEETSLDDLDNEKVNEFFKLDLVQRQEDFRPGLSDQDQLLQLGLLQKSYPTYGVLLCLGKAPTKWLTGAFTRCIYWKGQDRHSGWTDDQEYRGNLIKQYESSCNFLKRCLRFNRIIGRDGSVEQWEVPFRVLEESLANALIHREYANPNNFVHRADHVCLDVFSDRIEISNPGGPPPPMTLEMLGIENESHPRNPQIVRIFYLNGYVEKVGSGIQRMQQLMKEAGLPPPKLQLSKTETFKVVLYRPQQSVEEPVEYIHNQLEELRENQKELIEDNKVTLDTFPLVFVSHTPVDRGFVNLLKSDLYSHGISIWIDGKGIRQDMPIWEETIRAAIRASHVVLLIVSPEAQTSSHVRDELRIAKFYQRPVYPIWVRGTTWMEAIPLGWDGIPYIDAREDHYEMAIHTIERMLRTTIISPPVAPPLVPSFEPRNPYKGLRAFSSNDAGDFFGRSALIKELIHMLETSLAVENERSQGVRLLALVGPSGSGKSSMVMAGLLPYLQSGSLSGSKEWVYLEPITPGVHPIESLTLALSNQIPEKSLKMILEDLEGDSARGLHLYASYLVKQLRTYVVLVVDQFEEVFTLSTNEQERQQFLDLLVTACTQKDGPLIVILTLRADFYDRLMQYPELYMLIANHLTPMLPMVLSDLRAMITQPANLPDVQLTFEGNLVGDMLFDIQGQVGALPLLQFTLEQLFERREGHLLTEHAYQEIGGIKGALAKHAEECYLALPSPAHRQYARALFLRLLDPGMTEQETTRRRAARTEFQFADPEQTRLMQETLDTFVNARLLTTTASERTGITTIEVSHEALIREWPRLVNWLHEARDDIHLQQSISKDATTWERRNRSGDRLYQGTALKEAQAWVKRNAVSRQEQAFLRASAARQRRNLLLVVIALLLVITSSGIAGWAILFQPNPDHVTTTNDDGAGSLRWAIKNAPSNSTITFAPSLTGHMIILKNVDIHITQQNLIIQGPATGSIMVRLGGGSVFVDTPASVTIADIAFQGSHAENQSSVIRNNGKLTLKACVISGNIDHSGKGGGIYSSGMLTLTNSVLSGNTAFGVGGGIYNDGGVLTLINSVLSGNIASGSGGGIYNSGTLALTNSTLSGNTASGSGGGGISFINRSSRTAYATLIFCTIVNNKAANSDGFDIAVGENFLVDMKANIVGGNDMQGKLIIGSITSGGYNIIQKMSSVNFAKSTAHSTDRSVDNLIHVLGPSPKLGNNGGPTEVYQLIFSGNNLAIGLIPQNVCTDATSHRVLTDQRGMPRPGKNKQFCDSGAYEYQDS